MGGVGGHTGSNSSIHAVMYYKQNIATLAKTIVCASNIRPDEEQVMMWHIIYHRFIEHRSSSGEKNALCCRRIIISSR